MITRHIPPYFENEMRSNFEGLDFDINNQNHTSILIDWINRYDFCLEETIKTGEVQEDYIMMFDKLDKFAIVFPNIMYEKFLSKEFSSHLSYFYNGSIEHYREIARKDYENKMRHYERMR